NTSGNPAEVNLTLDGDAVGTYIVTLTATDNHATAPETTTIDLEVNVLDCECSAPPSITCGGNETVSTDPSNCNAFVSPTPPTLSSSCFGSGSLDFDGIDDYVNYTNPMTGSDFTIEFWFKPPSTSWEGVLFDMSEDDAAQGALQKSFFIDASDSDIRFRFESADESEVDIEVAHDFSEIRWYHVAAVGGFTSNSNHTLYVDGVSVGTSSVNTSGFPSTFSVPQIGYAASPYGTTRAPFGGQIDNFRVFGTKLSSTVINEVMCSDLSNSINRLLLSFLFEDGTGSAVVLDNSPDIHNGSLVNADVNTIWVSSDLVTSCTTLTNDFNGTDDASGTYPIGSTVVTWTATNGSGNSSTCTQTVTVNDTENPTISCAANVSVGTDADDCFATVALTDPT
ncbi:MAG: LamG-like jellyroll fold domain-containing protein, partial [Flavobacteriales bacterium]